MRAKFNEDIGPRNLDDPERERNVPNPAVRFSDMVRRKERRAREEM